MMEVLGPVRQVSKARSALGENPRIKVSARGFVTLFGAEGPPIYYVHVGVYDIKSYQKPL